MLSMASLLTMGIIAVSRYFRVVRPEKYTELLHKQRILIYTAVVWPLSGRCFHFFLKMADTSLNRDRRLACAHSKQTLLTLSSLNACLLQHLWYSSQSATPKCFTESHKQIKFSREKITLRSSEQT